MARQQAAGLAVQAQADLPGSQDLAVVAAQERQQHLAAQRGVVGFPLDVEETRVGTLAPPFEHVLPPGIGAAADAHVVRHYVHEQAHAALPQPLDQAQQRRLAAQFRIDPGRVDHVVAVAGAGPRAEQRRGVEMADAQVGEIVQPGQGIVEGEAGVELQAQGSAGLNHGRPPRHPGGCVRAGTGAGRPAAFRASARRFPASAAASSGGRRRGRAGSAAPGCPGRPPGAVAPTARGCPDIADAGVQRHFGGGVGIDRRFEAGGQRPALLGAQFQVGRAFLGAGCPARPRQWMSWPATSRTGSAGRGCWWWPWRPPAIAPGHEAFAAPLEEQHAGTQHLAACQFLAQAFGHGAEVLADDQRRGATGLQRQQAQQLALRVAQVGAGVGRLAARDQPETLQAHHVVDA